MSKSIDHSQVHEIAMRHTTGYEDVNRLARAYLDARANMRTPGTVEVCEMCGDTPPIAVCMRPKRDFTGEPWPTPCPLKPGVG